MKKQYQNPAIECVVLMDEDVITTSAVNLSNLSPDEIINWSDL